MPDSLVGKNEIWGQFVKPAYGLLFKVKVEKTRRNLKQLPRVLSGVAPYYNRNIVAPTLVFILQLRCSI